MKAVINIVVGLIAAAACAFISMKVNAPVENEVQVSPDEKTTEQRARPSESGEETTADLPVAVRAQATTPEGIFRIVQSFRQREDSLRAREQSLNERENRLKLVMRDIRTEQAAIDGLKAQVEERILTVEGLMTDLDNKRQEWMKNKTEQEAELKKYEAVQTTMNEAEKRQIKKWSDIVKGVAAPQASEYLKEMANSGEMERAAQILANLEPRDASKILAELKDPPLVLELSKQFTQLRTAQAKGNAKR